jgi:hypothetical protein
VDMVLFAVAENSKVGELTFLEVAVASQCLLVISNLHVDYLCATAWK